MGVFLRGLEARFGRFAIFRFYCGRLATIWKKRYAGRALAQLRGSALTFFGSLAVDPGPRNARAERSRWPPHARESWVPERGDARGEVLGYGRRQGARSRGRVPRRAWRLSHCVRRDGPGLGGGLPPGSIRPSSLPGFCVRLASPFDRGRTCSDAQVAFFQQARW